MDAGAHFHCCDLQVHTPRDNDWVGDCPATGEARRAFALEFIAACRQKGLDAVAITDHHDLALFPYIREAAVTERDAAGQPVSLAKRIVVFPGLELTLALPCQALLLFDPDMNEPDLERAMAALGITPAPPSAPKANHPVQRLQTTDLNELYRRLGEHPTLRDRFIVLPNLNDGGEDTLLRHGFFDHYKKMVCVGGYVDGPCADHGRRHIIDGHDPAWGRKRVGLIQTSDSRHRDFSSLGSHATWIKWSIASTEALRQACLAPDSRIRYSPPSLPDNWISKLEVSDSKHFGPISFEFNPQLNTIIGGRGSGKSTILEYLRWALCDQPYVHHEEEGTELPDFEKRRRSLIAGTLKQAQGTVVIDYFRHGVLHRIRRDGVTGRVYLKVAEQDECEASEETVQNLAQIQGYSQKQLSHVSVRAQELVRLLKTPIAQELASNRSQIEAGASNLRQAFERSESRRNLLSQLEAVELDLASKHEQIRALSQEMRDLPAEQRNDIDAHPLYVQGQRLAASYTSSLEGAFDAVGQARAAINKAINELPVIRAGRPRESLELLRSRTSAALAAFMEQLDSIVDAISGLRDELRPVFQGIEQEIASHKARYEAAASESSIIQERLESLRRVSEEAAKNENDVADLRRTIGEIGDAEADLRAAREQWRAAVERESHLLEQQATKLTADSAGDLRVRVDRAKNFEPLKRSLLDAVRGAGITTPEKFDSLVQSAIESGNPISAWLELGEELIALARVGPHLPIGAELPRTPKLTAAGFIPTELRRIATKLNLTAAFQLSLFYPASVPVFEYRTADGTYTPFEEASPGQQATALIALLLNQSAGPLVVDQPEDDLDNSTILSVAERLWSAKEKRQIIFTTHNANLVVIGDAELVLNCAYRSPVVSARVHVADQGAIDNPRICEVITSVIEGGAEAFRLRKERYGF